MLSLDIMNSDTTLNTNTAITKPIGKIEIIKQPSNLIYFDVWTDIEVNVRSSEKQQSQQISPKDTTATSLSDDNFYKLVTGLCYYNEDQMLKTVDSDCLETVFDQSTSNSFNLGPLPRKLKLKCKISSGLDTSVSYFIQTYIRRQQEYDTDTEKNFTMTKTKAFRLITSKLKVTPIDWEDIWYKDEGGRDKCMQVDLGLYNSQNELVMNRRIQLKLTLMYESSDDGTHAKVVKQDILNVFGSPRHFIDPETAKTTIRFRIEDVSKNHQGQNFVVHVAADTSRGNNDDVASIYAPSVSVRSKRNKRQRTGTKDNNVSSSYGYENAPPPSPGPAHAMGSYLAANPHMQPPSLAPPAAAAGAAVGIPATPINSHPSRLQAGLGSGSSRDSPSFIDGIEDISSLREAMRGVIRWTDEVINGLYPLQWQVIGYAQYPDGTLDYNRPYHSMPNPNVRISKILSMYSDATREQLRVLLGAVENTEMNRTSSIGGTEPPSKRMAVSNDSNEYPNVIPDGRAVPPHHYIPAATPLARQEPNDSIKRHTNVSGGRHPAHDGPMLDNDIQNEIEYVLGVPYKSNLTGNIFGFPAYNERNELLGFYQESRTNIGVGRFIPVTSYTNKDLSPIEVSQATSLLLDAMKNNSPTVHALKDWGSISSLFEHVMVNDWSNRGRVGNGWWGRRDTEV